MSKMCSPRMPNGFDLEIVHHPLTLKRVANIIVCLERLKSRRSESVLSTEFRDENLLSFIFESIVEEHLVFECSSSPAALEYTNVGEHMCSVTDTKKKSLVLFQDTELHAMMLQGGNDNRKVYLNMATYLHPSPPNQGRPVALCIKGTNMYLSCRQDDAVPTLHLEVVEDKSSLSRILSESEMVRFLFYKHDTGVNVSTLMSARFPDWYISTQESDDDNKVEMCQQTAERCTTFTIQIQSSL